MNKIINRKSLTDCLVNIIDYRGKTPKKLGSDWAEFGYRAISANNVKFDGLIKLDSIKFLDEKTYSKWMKDEIKNGDLLLTSEAPAGQVMLWITDEKIVLSQRLFALRTKNDVYNKYLKYYLQSSIGQNEINKNTSGSTVFGISAKMFDLIQVLLPNYDSQVLIGDLLYAIDSKVELNNRTNAELEQMAKTLYDYWFVQFDFPDQNKKPYKTSGGKMVWSEELKREIPEGWEVGTLLDIADYTNGLPCQKFRPTGEAVLKVIKIKEMHEGFSAKTELVRSDIPPKVIIENGDVLFSWSASLEVQIWSRGKGALNQHIFKVTSDKYPKSFYYYQLLNYLQHFKMMAENRKTTMGHITQEHLQQSRIAIPPKELTLELEKTIAPIFKKKVMNEIENQKLSELRDWLLPMLMNGQVNVI